MASEKWATLKLDIPSMGQFKAIFRRLRSQEGFKKEWLIEILQNLATEQEGRNTKVICSFMKLSMFLDFGEWLETFWLEMADDEDGITQTTINKLIDDFHWYRFQYLRSLDAL